MSVKRESEAVTGHPPRRGKCKKSPDGEHDMRETSRDDFSGLGPDFAEHDWFVWSACAHCGKKRLHVEPKSSDRRAMKPEGAT